MARPEGVWSKGGSGLLVAFVVGLGAGGAMGMAGMVVDTDKEKRSSSAQGEMKSV